MIVQRADGVRCEPEADVDLSWSQQNQAMRSELRAWMERNLADWRDEIGVELSGDTREGFEQQLRWERRLHEARWSAVSWPREYGGRDGTLWDWLIFEEEYWRAGAPQRVVQNGLQILAPSIFEHGSPDQKRLLLPRIAAARDLWCQGWSEPDAGSDLAAVSSSARRVAGGWVLDGQKTWTTRGAFCSHLFGLFRSEPGSSRHRGLTYLLVPLDLDGITVRGFGRLDGDEGFAEVFFDEVLLADDAVAGGVVLGDVGAGWQVAVSATSTERGLLRSPGRFQAVCAELIQLSSRCAVSPEMRQRLAEAWMRADAYRLQTLQTITTLTSGGEIGSQASLAKLWWSELDIELHEIALDLLGPQAEVQSAWSKGHQFALAGPIYAGTNEIQRNIIAERVLGLPR